MAICKEIDEYIGIVRAEEYPVCREQKLLCDYVGREFRTGEVRIDEDQLERYMGLQKYFEYELFPWEKFLFALHNCAYRRNGLLRWPELLIFVGRGSGKNGYLAFEDFALLTPVNGVRNYNIDIFANSEDQAETTFKDVYEVLERNAGKMAGKFEWNKEVIRNVRTGSELRFRTSNPKTKDGGRPGKVDFDEYHQYENYKTLDVARTGLGKKKYPRSTIITTNGDVRDGPLDHELERAEKILKGVIPDNGLLPYLCRLDDKGEVDDPWNWHKANPSLRYFPHLMDEMRREYEDYKMDRIGNKSFMVKRMNLPEGDLEQEVTPWENIMAASRDMPDLEGCTGMAGLDYARTTDFVAAGILIEWEETWHWITHTWVCRSNKASLSRIKFPLEDAAARGLLTFVDEVEIPPEMPAQWLMEQGERYNIEGLALDMYRYQLMRKALMAAGFDASKEGRNNIKLVRPSDIMQIAPVITSRFAKHKIAWGENPLMRWYTNNAKQVMDGKGNVTYGKIEPKSRKTDGFMAMVAAATRMQEVEGWNSAREDDFQDVYVFG